MAERYPTPPALLERYGLRAKKSWGQNFLGDDAILDDIARLAVRAPGELVVELGAGLGHLTARLLAHGARVVAVERDRDMARVLRGEMGDRIALLEADAARLDYARLAAEHGRGGRVAIAGNLPYHLTSPILFSLVDQAERIERAVLLLQREVAERLAVPPGERECGILSVLLQREADVSIERIVPPGAFVPPPKVASAVLLAVFRPPADAVVDPARFRRIVKAGFSKRRKTLRNSLERAKVVEDSEALGRALAAAGVDPGRRAETLTLTEWAAIERGLSTSARLT